MTLSHISMNYRMLAALYYKGCPSVCKASLPPICQRAVPDDIMLLTLLDSSGIVPNNVVEPGLGLAMRLMMVEEKGRESHVTKGFANLLSST
jgi:hypothetical protein